MNPSLEELRESYFIAISKLTNEETSVKEKTGPVKKRVLMPSNQVEQLTLF